jgi:hypothetical protein
MDNTRYSPDKTCVTSYEFSSVMTGNEYPSRHATTFEELFNDPTRSAPRVRHADTTRALF